MIILQALRKKDPRPSPLASSHKTGRDDSGFTLLEVLVAIAILGLSLVTLFELFAGSLKMARVSGDYLKATLLAQKKMNDLRLVAYAPDAENETGIFKEEPDYRWSVAVEPYATEFDRSPDKKELEKVTVTVAWKSGHSPKAFRLVRLYNPMTWNFSGRDQAAGGGKGNGPGGKPTGDGKTPGDSGEGGATHISGNLSPGPGGTVKKQHVSGR